MVIACLNLDLFVARLLYLGIIVARRLCIVATALAAIEGIEITKLSFTAGEERLACVVHLFGEGELLAVENESSLVLYQLLLSPNALIAAPVYICLAVG